MSFQREMQGGGESTFNETFDPIFGEDAMVAEEEDVAAVSYLVPRLAAYAEASSGSSSPSDADADGGEENGSSAVLPVDAMAEQDHTRGLLSGARDSGENSAAHVADEGIAEEESRGRVVGTSSLAGVEGVIDVELKEDEVDRADARDVEATYAGSIASNDSVDLSEEEDDRHGTSSSFSYTNAFALSRVKELLKFEGSSSIVSKDAAAAACEAVALLTRDLVTVAAAEASRKNRKTITYDDVARVAQLLDRFSFLAEVVPPAPSSVSGAALGAGKTIVLGSSARSSAGSGVSARAKRETRNTSSRSESVQDRARAHDVSTTSSAGTLGSSVARSKTAHARVTHSSTGQGVHPQPGGMRQATLRF
jgi:histone H3/H4